jgi:hypothetical protein
MRAAQYTAIEHPIHPEILTVPGRSQHFFQRIDPSNGCTDKF